jgi:hypothetical protein
VTTQHTIAPETGAPHTRAGDPGDADAADRYDPSAMQERWLPVWDELAPFRSGRADDPRPLPLG